MDGIVLYSILSVIIFQCILVSLFLLTNQKGKKISNRLLGFFFLFLGINLIDGFINLTGYFQTYPSLAHSADGFVFLLGPLLYFYTRSIVYRDFQLRFSQITHLLAFIISTTVFLIYYHSQSYEDKVFIQKAISERQLPWGFYLTILLVYGHVFIYFFLALKEIRNYHKKIKDLFSSKEKVSLKWLRFMIYSMTGILLFSLFNVMVPYIGFGNWFQFTLAIVIGLFFLFVNTIVFKGLQQPQIFTGFEKEHSAKYSQNSLTSEEKENIKKRLIFLMEEEKLFLDPDIDLEELSDKMNLSSKKVSQVINDCLGKNYYDFINTYRINEAKRLFTISPDPKLTILEVLYEVGFNSKSSFNTVFKEKTGMTPSTFRKVSSQKNQNF